MNNIPSLFRQEVITEKTNRLHGEVVLRQQVSARLMVLALVTIIGIAIIWLIAGEYARTEQARGLLVTTQPSAKIVATRPGVITTLAAREGMIVKKGDMLAIIDLEKRDGTGAASSEDALTTIDVRLALGDQQATLARDRANKEKSRLLGLEQSLISEASDVDNQIAIQRDIVASNRALFERIEEVVKKGFVTQVDYEK
jgi:membrane fusion protein